MRIALLGEAGHHRDVLLESLHGDHTVVALPAEASHDAGYDGELAEADVVVSLRLSRPRGQAPPWGLLHVPGAGLDGIDLAALAPTTTVCNVYEHEVPIAEFVMGALLEWEIRPGDLRASLTPQTWSRVYRDRVPHGELYGRQLGLIGYGRVGRAIAARALAFGMRVAAVDGYAAPDGRVTPLGADRLPDLLAGSDYVVVTCPLTEETRGLLDLDAFGRMKRSAVLVNVARAPIVDEDALHRALTDGLIAGAILDVWYRYPSDSTETVPPSRHDLTRFPNAWCTPHSSAWTYELPRRRYAVIADNIDRFARGEELRNVVRAGAPGPTDGEATQP